MTVEHLPGKIAGLAVATGQERLHLAARDKALLFMVFQQPHRRLHVRLKTDALALGEWRWRSRLFSNVA